MKAVLLALGVLGLAAIFSLSEPTPASAKLVTSEDVRLVSERVTAQSGHAMSQFKNRGGPRARAR